MKSESNEATRRVRVGDLAEMEGERVRVIAVDGRRLALFEVDGQLLCIDDRCPHAGGRLSRGTLCETVVSCPRHGWRFDIVDGRCLSDPRFEVRRYDVEIDEGVIWVTIPSR